MLAPIAALVRPRVDALLFGEVAAHLRAHADRYRATPEIKLPLEAAPPVQTFLSGAIPLSIWLGRQPLWPLISCGYYGLYFPSGVGWGGRYGCPRLLDQLTLPQLLSLECASSRNLAPALKRNRTGRLMAEMLEGLSAGEFVFGNVNEYYIPGTAPYRHGDLRRHGILISGWRPKTLSFTALAYFGEYYTEASIGALDLVRGLRSRGLFDLPQAYNHKLKLRTIRLADRIVFRPNADLIIDQLKRYVDSSPPNPECFAPLRQSSRAVQAPWDAETVHCTYGLDTWDRFREWTQAVADGKAMVDMRATRILVEHKRIMSTRLAELENRGFLTPRGRLSGKYREVLDAVMRLHYAMMENRRSLSNRRVLLGVVKELEAAKQMESAVLRAAIEVLTGNALARS